MFEYRYPQRAPPITSLLLNLQQVACPRNRASIFPNTQAPRDLKVFHLFPQLPLEIRLMIWRETFPRPRQLLLMNHVHGTMLRSTDPSDQGPSIRYQIVPPPFALNINRESHEEVLAHYHPLSTSCATYQPSRTQKSILFNPKRDTIYLSWDECVKNPPPAARCSAIFSPLMLHQNEILDKLGKAGLEKVEILVLGQIDGPYDSLVDLSKAYPRKLELFTGLRELRLARTRGSGSPVGFRKLQKYAASILRCFRNEQAGNPRVRIPVVTFWEMKFDSDWDYWMGEGRLPSTTGAGDEKGSWKPEANYHLRLPPIDQYKYFPLLDDTDLPVVVAPDESVDREPGYWD